MDGYFLSVAAFFRSEGMIGVAGLILPLILFEFPRFVLMAFALIWYREPRPPQGYRPPPYTVAQVGHNEGNRIANCVRSLEQQSFPPAEIIVVSDGSTDEMPAKLKALQSSGRIAAYHRLELRGGRSAATNLACLNARNEVIVSIDSDTSFDRHAMRNIIFRLEDPEVAGVSGNILARNAGASFLAEIQNLEYRLCIGAGRSGLDMINQLSLVSGAFGAYRRSAIQRVSGMDAVSGEDLDFSLRLRRAGYRIAFARNAICRTDVPTRIGTLIRQRYRWERDSYALRMRRHGAVFNPRSPHFTMRNLVSGLDFFLFDLTAVIILPFFILAMVEYYGQEVFALLALFLMAYALLDGLIIIFDGAANAEGEGGAALRLIPAYTLYNMLLIRLLRILAYSSEMLFRASELDDFVPSKVKRASSGAKRTMAS